MVERKITDEEERQIDIADQYEVLTNAVKVHTTGTQLNEDATLANLNVKFTPLAEWVSRNVHMIGIIESYMQVNKTMIKRSNYIDNTSRS